MSESKYLKCPCQNCGASIEFPVHGIGSSVPCPHCHHRTMLFAPPIPPTIEADHEEFPAHSQTSGSHEPVSDVATSQLKPRGRVAAIAFGVILVGAIVGFIAFRHNETLPPDDKAADTPTDSDGSISSVPKTGLRQSQQTSGSPSAPKAREDLKVGIITLEKAKGTSLVYAVGVLRNDSDHQRFDVHIELELSDAKGNNAGTAKDYRSVIEPLQEWRFRALVLDPKAVAAKLSSIREQE